MILLLTAASADSFYARTIRRLQVNAAAAHAFVWPPPPSPTPTPPPPPPHTQTLHEHDPSTFAKMFSRPLAEHVRDNAPQEDSGVPKQPQVDVKFLLGGEEGEHGGGGRH